jgi:hypothetical protein
MGGLSSMEGFQMDLYTVLWEDLNNAQARVQDTLTALQALQQAVAAGQIDQPTRQDSKHLNRLLVLADLLYAEVRPLTGEITPAAQPGSNGHRPPAQ